MHSERDSVTDVQDHYPTVESIDKAKAEGKDTHELGVIGVWFEISDEANPAIEIILNNAEKIEDISCTIQSFDSDTCPDNVICQYNNDVYHDCICADGWSGKNCQTHASDVEEEIEHIDLDLSDILSEAILEKGFWTYEGSLTTPPFRNKYCSITPYLLCFCFSDVQLMFDGLL